MWAGAKSMTEKITEGHGLGEQLPKMREHGRFLGAAGICYLRGWKSSSCFVRSVRSSPR